VTILFLSIPKGSIAEAIGVATSAISSIQVTAQLAVRIDKVKRFWEKIKQAHLNMELLMRELDLLNVMTEHL
jgi:hypothetical protein